MAEVIKENTVKNAKNIVRGMKGKNVYDLINENKRAINEVAEAINNSVEIEVNPVVVVKKTVPSTPTSSGEAGDVAYDGDYVYICVEEDSWVRFEVEDGWGA